jgi:hypothetical protein
MKHGWLDTFQCTCVIIFAVVFSGRCLADDDAVPVGSSRGPSSFHALIGGQGSIPGGTYALGQQTSAMSLMFERANIVKDFGIALRYLNEGFLGPQNEPAPLPLWTPLHYKDAFALLLTYWRPTSTTCRLGAAAGPETYFDTTAKMFRSAYGNRHGAGVQASLSEQCTLTRRLAVELTATRSFDVASFDSSTLLVGLVFTPQDVDDSERGPSRPDASGSGRLEITAGRIDVDDFDVSHDDGTTTWITYGQGLQGSFGLDASLLREKVAGVMDRRGGALEVTAEHDFWASWFRIFAGAGPYLAHAIDCENGTSRTQINLLISYGVRIAVSNRFSLVAKLGRVAASSGRNDADLVTIGFSFKAP